MDKRTSSEELVIAHKALVFQDKERGKRAAELVIANKELLFQNKEKENRAAELVIANTELLFQNEEKGKRAAELVIANEELIFQSNEKGKRAAELAVANIELIYQDREKEKRAAELVIANEELIFQNDEKGKRAAELAVANEELIFQNDEKGKRAAELVIANEELIFQNKEKEMRAAELVIANTELIFQNDEKGKRAAELAIANEELIFQNDEKVKRAAELVVANAELVFQNEEKEKRTAELLFANNELLSFNYITSHDLQEPLRKIQMLSNYVLEKETENLSDKGRDYLNRIQLSSGRMKRLILDLLAYFRINATERKFEKTDLNMIIEEVKDELKEDIDEKHAVIEVGNICPAMIIPFQFIQLMHNLIGNALKFSLPGIPPHIVISSKNVKGSKKIAGSMIVGKEYCMITVQDNGIGFSSEYNERIFEVFQKLHTTSEYAGTGIGLAIVKKIVENHNGIIKARSEISKGATFEIYIPS